MKTLAVALYENEAESDDELTFKKSDLFEVLQQDYLEMKGWWLCKLIRTDKIGLAAGNRLKIIKDEKIIKKLNAMLNSAELFADLSPHCLDKILLNGSNSSKSSSIISMSSTVSSHSSHSSDSSQSSQSSHSSFMSSNDSSSSTNSSLTNNQKVKIIFKQQ